ncbi:MAG: class I mannose-6-phosphate isomerase [Tannerellaceae bacterium]|jgi:mannose-6-phosphate isomerase|nr:class I mannose-6-phosphate isomerase [Tannerellaceae bacterium]
MLYPIVFKPILKNIIWGGSDICPFKGISPVVCGVGESWELSHVKDNYSIVDNGPLEGMSIDDLIGAYGERLVGRKVIERFGSTFPLLIKFIDARDNLSVQVHPGDTLAKARHNSFGKTEMWYVIKAAPDAALYSGFSTQIDKEEYIRRVSDNTVMDVLQRYTVREGDVFFLPAGRVHAIGSGCFIAEIQQTSDITYRIYDYDRKDAAGNGRQLHTELAKDAIDFTMKDDYRTYYQDIKDAPVTLAHCPYFTTNLLDLKNQMARDLSSTDSFTVYICVDGQASLADNRGSRLTLRRGHTALIPADTARITLHPQPTVKLIEARITTD